MRNMISAKGIRNFLHSSEILDRQTQALFFGPPGTSTFAELLKKDNSVTIHQRNIQRLAIEMFKIAKNLEPKILRSLFVFDVNTRNDRTFH